MPWLPVPRAPRTQRTAAARVSAQLLEASQRAGKAERTEGEQPGVLAGLAPAILMPLAPQPAVCLPPTLFQAPPFPVAMFQQALLPGAMMGQFLFGVPLGGFLPAQPPRPS